MALKGTIRDFGLADIFQLIGIQRKTGLLVLTSGARRVQVSFLSGGVVSADSNERALEERLGAVLVKSGKITDRQLAEALKNQKTTLKRLGKILIENKAISVVDLRDALTVQTTQIVHHLFRWRDGEYDFSQEETIDYDREHFVPIPAESILMEGARMIDEWPIIERRIASFEMVLRRKGGPARDDGAVSVYETDIDFGLMETGGEASDGDPLKLSSEEQSIFKLVDGRSTVQDIIDRSQVGEFETCRILYELMSRDVVEEGLGANAGKVQAPPAPPRQSLMLRAAMLILPPLALVSLVFSLQSPLSPFGGSHGRDSFRIDRIKIHLSQARLSRIDQALRQYHLERQTLPSSLEALIPEGFLDGKDLQDPWGRPYLFEPHPSGYVIRGFDSAGEQDASVTVQSQFVAIERLAVEPGALAPPPQAASWP